MVRFTQHSGRSGSKAYVYCQSCRATKTNFGDMCDFYKYILLVNQPVQVQNVDSNQLCVDKNGTTMTHLSKFHALQKL